MVRAMYAFSGDPITYGHIDIIERAAKAFDEVIVGIGINPDKKYMFSLDERTDMANRSLKSIPNARVVPFQGLLVDFAYENDIPVVVKAIRNQVDVDYEKVLHQVGEMHNLGIDTFVLYARPELEHVSSSNVKGIQKEHGEIHECVPLYVKQCLEARMSGQYIVGITGEMGAGKSYVARKFMEIGKREGITVHNVEFDDIPKQIYTQLDEPRYHRIRKEIIDAFGKEVSTASNMIDAKALRNIVFSDPDKLKKLTDIVYTPLKVRFRKEIYRKKGMILVNAALIAEADIGYMCNNNVVLVTADSKEHEERKMQKECGMDQVERRMSIQLDADQKRKVLEERIKETNNGKVFVLENRKDDDLNIEKIFHQVIDELKVRKDDIADG